MKKSKTIIINVVASIFSNLLILILGLIVPRIIIVNYGSDTNGLTGTISQVFMYLALLESGISAAAKNALYKPIQENDKPNVSLIVSGARRYYRKISIIYFVVVLVIAFLMPLFLRTDVDYWTITIYTLLEGLASVITFFFTSVWVTFLGAYGKTYVTSLFTLFYKVGCYASKIVFASIGLSIAFIQLGYLAVSVIQALLYWLYMRKRFGWIDYSCADSSFKLKDRRSYVITEIAWTIFSSTDMIVLSIFVSTALSSVYSVYNMVFIAINTMLNAAYVSVSYTLGRTYFEDIEKYKRLHDGFNSIFLMLTCSLMSVSNLLIIPFIKIYTSGVTDVNYLYTFLPVLFCSVQILSWTRYVSGNLSGFAGYAKKVALVSLVEAFVNLGFSILLVNFFDITGVLVATVIALPIKAVYLTWLAEHRILKRSPKKTISIFAFNYFVFGISVLLYFLIDFDIKNYWEFIAYGLILTSAFFAISLIGNTLINKDMLKAFKMFFSNKTQRKT